MRRLVGELVRWSARRLDRSGLILANRHIAGKYLPLPAEHGVSLRVPSEESAFIEVEGEDLPVPPQHLWLDWATTARDYLATGREDVESMIAVLGAGGADADAMDRVLDLGCGAGRMLRHFPGRAGDRELWGLDIDAVPIAWCQEHLSPPFLFATVTTEPHLPFEDDYFDLVYCGSVFTHISELADAWFLELRRVLRPGGFAYVTIHDKTSIDILLGPYKDREEHAFLVGQLRQADRRTSVLSRDFSYLSMREDPDANVFYDADRLVERWSRLARFVSLTERAMDYQSALLFQKPK